MFDSYSFVVRQEGADCLARADEGLTTKLGYSNDELAAKPLSAWIHPDDRQAIEHVVGIGKGAAAGRHATKSGDWIPFDWQIQTENDVVLAFGQPGDEGLDSDVDHAKSIGRHDSMSEMLNAIALIVESKNPGMFCSILLVDPKTKRVSVGAGPSLPKKYNDAVEGLQVGPLVGSCGTAAFWNVPVVVADIERDPLWRDLRVAAKLANVSSCWSQPIRTVSGAVIGAMALYDQSPSTPARYQMDALAIAARMAGLAIDRVGLEAQLRQAAKMEAIGLLAGGIAHDFNNLLGVILGNADLAISALSQQKSVREMLDDIIAASGTAAELCNQLLAYAGRSALSAEIVDCNSLIRELSKLLHVSLSKKARLRLELDGNFGVLADPAQLRQVLMNLITNAAEAIGNTDGEVLIETRELTITPDHDSAGEYCVSLPPGDYAEISVHDTGSGMSRETRLKIFDPFFSTKDNGRGLGLAAVNGIVDAHGWVLEVKSAPGRGTVFSLVVPRTEAPKTKANEPIIRSAPQVARVLVVEDEPGMLKITTKILRAAGMDVMQAADGLEAIDFYRDHWEEIDCVLLDLNMPKLDGEEVFREMKKIHNGVRVLLTSGFTEQEVLDRFRGGGLRGALQKPFATKALLDKVSDALR